jgi:hypothetical protein
MRLVLRTLWDRLRQKLNLLNGRLEAPERGHIHAEVVNDHAVAYHRLGPRHEPDHSQVIWAIPL